MCILCRKRFEQRLLFRLQRAGNNIVQYAGSGRSFYLCKECIKSPKILKQIERQYRAQGFNMDTIEHLRGENQIVRQS
jgi:predicted RNA-binding protein YlxR (DUF448 family)